MGETTPSEDEVVSRFIESLPDPEGARAFQRRVDSDTFVRLEGKPRLFARVLTLAAYSPFLSETLLRHPEYISWLERETERDLSLVKSTEKLAEELARFLLSASSPDRRTSLSRFKRREFLRIYLRDCLGVATLSELTEELSNLADVLLADALAQAFRELTRLHGAPLERDDRGRVVAAEMAVIALGKLGCRELNYASDIDLFFLYSSPGETAGDGRRAESVISNKEFFTSVADRLVQMIGSGTGEGAVYRTDLRLRPYGRDGDLVWDLARAVDYYRNRAEAWERQTLIRARAAAGSERLATRFLEQVRDVIFSSETREDSFAGVRRVKEKIDRAVASRSGGFNVKLGPGGIREIEFIAQALQLEYGGREPWVRSTQTLIVLARLSEKGYLSEPERARLSAAYTFLRTVEHRLQMEHGAQTHALPTSPLRLTLIARRCGYLNEADPAARLSEDLETHTQSVRAIYNRIFFRRAGGETANRSVGSHEPQIADDELSRAIAAAVHSLTRLIETDARSSNVEQSKGDKSVRNWVDESVRRALPLIVDPLRSLKNLSSWADSSSTYQADNRLHLTRQAWPLLIERLARVLSSPYLASILIARPRLGEVLVNQRSAGEQSCADLLRCGLSGAEPAARPDALRRCWYECVIEIGYSDMMNVVQSRKVGPSTVAAELKSSNRAQTALAEAALSLSVEIALENIGVPATLANELPFSVLALGRLGHAGMDYGSDLDLLVVFDDSVDWPPQGPGRDSSADFGTLQEFCARLTSGLVNTLGSITREGMIYRVDLRLRPEGKSGPLVRGLSSLLWYIANRASAWEHSAYLKVREVAGCAAFGAEVKRAICEACFDAASKNPQLGKELREMRMRLEREKARNGRPDIKWGPGGMTDAYFVTRYLQLAHRIYFPPELGTGALIEHLAERRALAPDDASDMLEGYTFLRRLDHWIRLLVDRPTPKLPASTRALRDIGIAMEVESAEQLETTLQEVTHRMRRVFDKTLG
jgi:glutamate-ammonia-ligase adenylyltransferase